MRAWTVPRYDSLKHSSRYPGLEQVLRSPASVGSLDFFEFRPVAEIPAKKGTWLVQERLDYGVPNFPEGETVTHSMLAQYEPSDKSGDSDRPGLLRMSEEPFSQEDFYNDLAAVTQHYVERPLIIGFPSRIMTRRATHIVAAMLGVAIGFGSGFGAAAATGTPLLSAGLWGTIGETLGVFSFPAVTGTLNSAAEWRARRRISALDQYFAGDKIPFVLGQERTHANHATVQRELYGVLKQKSPTLTPEAFLQHAYRQMPNALLAERIKEVEQQQIRQQQPELEQLVKEGILPDLVKVAEILLARPSPQRA